jgi:ElaB/YqjD/DUF883 family membrane-anchored ribosome-binding protein
VFTLEHAGQSGMSGTAERIGTAVGTAQRQMRRGLELVRRPAGRQVGLTELGERTNQLAYEAADRASRMMEDLEEEVSDVRQQAARRLDEWSELAGERLQEFRLRVRSALSRTRERAKEIADTYPLHTIAAIAGVCFVLGMALRLRRSHRG